MEKLIKITDLTKFPLFELKEGQTNPSQVWQPFEIVKDSNEWYLPIDAKDDLIKNNINFEEVEIEI
jgi:hypothetical protein